MKKNFKNLKILIAGCGHIGKRHVRILSLLGVKNIIVFDTNKDAVESLLKTAPQLKVANSFKEGITLVDTVFILTPSKLHIPMAIEAVEAGCHVFIEKPLSINMEGVDILENLAIKKNKKVMVGLCMRYHTGIIKAKELLNSNKLGRLISIRAMVGEHFPDVHPEYKTLYYAKYSGAFELMHDLDLALWFADQPVKKVHSVFGSYSDIGIEAPDTVEFLIGFENKCTATVHLDFFQIPRRRSLELIGTKGTIIIDFTSWTEYTLSIYSTDRKSWKTETNPTERDDMFKDEDLEFLEAIVNDKPIKCTIQEGCKSLKVIQAAQNKSPL